MNKITALLRELGLALPVGSVLTFVVMNFVVGSSTDLKLIYNQRQFVTAISRALTIPGAWMLLGSNALAVLAQRRQFVEDKQPLANLCVSIFVVLNTTWVIAPLASRVTAIAKLSLTGGELSELYAPLKRLEDRFGALNVFLLAIALTSHVFEA